MTKNRNRFIRDLLILSKLIISLAVTLTAFLGYIVYSGNFAFEVLSVVLGVFFMAAGSSALNHFQERRTDKLMERTKDRPIPSGRMKSEEVLFISILFLLTGGIILITGTNLISFLLAVLTFIWYNLVYTPLKRVTAFAVFPGSIIGGIPPMIGWTAAGGQLNDPKIWIIFLFFFIGQIPHFWLILLMNGKDYEKAGLSSLTKLLTESRIRQLTFFWIVSTALASLAFVVSGIIFSGTLVIILSLGALILVITFIKLPFYRDKTPEYRKDFILLNIFYMLVMLLVIAQYILF